MTDKDLASGRCLRPALQPLRGSTRYAVLGLACIAIAGWASFNVGFDYGSDTSLCVSLAVSGADPAGDNTFCRRAAPAENPIKRAARMTWLTVVGDTVRKDDAPKHRSEN